MKRLSWILLALVLFSAGQRAEAMYDYRNIIRYFGIHHGQGIHAHNGVEVYHGEDAYPHYRQPNGYPHVEPHVKKSRPGYRR